MRDGTRTGREDPTDGEGNGGDGWKGPVEGNDQEAPEGDSPERGAGAMGRQEGFVYFIETEGGEYVKIGKSRDVALRLDNLSTGNPDDLKLLGVISETLVSEKAIHRRFAAERHNREWFRNSAAVQESIRAALRGDFRWMQDGEDGAEKKVNITVEIDVTELGRAGGKARAANLTVDEMSAAMTKAVKARWEKYYAANPEKLKEKLARQKKAKAKKAGK